MGGLPDRNSPGSRRPYLDGMELDRHGLRHLWNNRIGLRPCHGHEHPGRER
jgi:hypothetical protein